jgi:hypothetical protein
MHVLRAVADEGVACGRPAVKSLLPLVDGCCSFLTLAELRTRSATFLR